MSDIASVEVTVRNRQGSPLVVHAFAEKAKAEIREKQAKKAKQAKAARNPEAEYLAARYVDDKGREGVPITALKKSLVRAASAFDGLKMTELRQAIFVDSIAEPGAAIVPLEQLNGSPAVGTMREDAVTIGNNVRGLTYRPVYTEWKIRLRIEYHQRLISEEQLLALLDHAGWGVGICEGRPEKTSALGWGRFERVVG